MADKLKFRKSKNLLGETVYVAEHGTELRFKVYRLDGQWLCEMWSLKKVGELDPIWIADKHLRTTNDTHRKYVYEDAERLLGFYLS
jgi:hypothetical protein